MPYLTVFVDGLIADMLQEVIKVTAPAAATALQDSSHLLSTRSSGNQSRDLVAKGTKSCCRCT